MAVSKWASRGGLAVSAGEGGDGGKIKFGEGGGVDVERVLRCFVEFGEGTRGE
jgi:hypothetical protein